MRLSNSVVGIVAGKVEGLKYDKHVYHIPHVTTSHHIGINLPKLRACCYLILSTYDISLKTRKRQYHRVIRIRVAGKSVSNQ